MKTKVILCLIVVCSLVSCKFYVMYKETAEPGFVCGKEDDQFITVYEKDKKEYEVYVRYNQSKYLYFNNTQRVNQPDYDSKKYRTEIQYIIVNTTTNNMFYVSTTPSRYIMNKDKNTYLIGNKGNSYFFNSYFIGKMNNDNMIFKNSKEKMTWKFRRINDTLDINIVIMHNIRANREIHSSTRLISEVLGDDFKFVKLKDFENFTYLKPGVFNNKDSIGIVEAGNKISLNRIRYIACGNQAVKVLLNYDNAIDDHNEFKNIFYKKGRIRYINDR
ncbi:hypothetical protein SAMN05421542_3478 [Chryseobacterium jejuense]|uniref:Uncharacterized protein n=2 Tax=Chryseobacterium jejuense TaxID=445960 RepID=A0A2X2WZ35_CHRJE|nr:hypothetical protein SAMN05421542_3478 [Chryseobacterium jejuense]SQB45978.1 Uncharacterised protein [Chryseobacterium jejuense]